VRLRRPDFTPVFSGRHRRPQRFRRWRIIEVVLLVILALFVLWAYHQHKPF
jgi:cell division protein FtsB